MADDAEKIAARVDAFRAEKSVGKKPSMLPKVAAVVGMGLATGGGLFFLSSGKLAEMFQGSEVQAFPDAEAADPLKIGMPDEPPMEEAALEVPKAQDNGDVKRLQDEVAKLKAQLERPSGEDPALAEVRADLVAAQAEIAALKAAQDAKALADLEAQRLAAAAAAEAAAAELEKAKIVAPAIVYGKGVGQVAGGQENAVPASYSVGGVQKDSLGLSANESYLRQGAAPLVVAEAAVMAAPERTLAQGTMIQAVLQGAINSDLPGNVVALVSEPVAAFSGDRIVVPAGSKLFGQYRSGVKSGQTRVLVLWTRLLTPDGQSVELAAVGGDQLGQGGLTGQVDKHFAERFSNAALVSIVGAAPGIAASRVSDDVTAEILSSVSEDLSNSVGSLVADQINIPPTISIAQGARVTVMVDRDVVMR